MFWSGSLGGVSLRMPFVSTCWSLQKVSSYDIIRSAIVHVPKSCPVCFQLMAESHGNTGMWPTLPYVGPLSPATLVLHSHQPGWDFLRAALQTKASPTQSPLFPMFPSQASVLTWKTLFKPAPLPFCLHWHLSLRSNLSSNFFSEDPNRKPD